MPQYVPQMRFAPQKFLNYNVHEYMYMSTCTLYMSTCTMYMYSTIHVHGGIGKSRIEVHMYMYM